jgi:hypothetical protein
MPAKGKSIKPRRLSAKKSAPSGKMVQTAMKTPQQARYVRDLLVRGEAAKLDEHGKLPLSATAVITKEHPDGTVDIKEVRKKLF